MNNDPYRTTVSGLTIPSLWCACGEYMAGDGHYCCPSCEDKAPRSRMRKDGNGYVGEDPNNVCRGQE